MDLVKKILELLEKYMPAFVVMLLKHQDRKITRLENEVKEKELDLKLKENHEKIDHDNASKSDSDVIDEAISRGGK